MPLFTKRIYDPPDTGDGYRLLTMRLWPRGVRKDKIDEWQKALSPSRDLLNDYRSGTIEWSEFEQRYVHEMHTREDAVEALDELKERVGRETVTILCSCKDETRCHRTLLHDLVTKE